MMTLCMDTSHRYLTIALIENDKIIGKIQKECFKKQSETILQQLDELCQQCDITPTQIDSICITKGPGSYTGVRIAMTIAKVFCALQKVDLYTLSTLRLFAGGRKDCMVVLDARANRGYTCCFKDGELIGSEHAQDLNLIKADLSDSEVVMGDAHLVDRTEQEVDYAQSFLSNKFAWQLIGNSHTCVPEYLKENSDYLVK